MDSELAKAHRAAGLRRHHRKIDRQVENIFEHFPDCRDPADFIRRYESVFGKFDFIYSRAHTTFGEEFGRDLSPEDAAWGTYRPLDGPPSMAEIEREADKIQREMDKWESRQAKKKPSRKR